MSADLAPFPLSLQTTQSSFRDGRATAYESDPSAEPFAFASGHRIDIAQAIEMHPQARKLLADEATSAGLRRTMIRTAIIMGFPVKG